MSDLAYSFDNLEAFVGRSLGTTAWVSVAQPRIDAFAECTEDRQWIHVDVDRARREAGGGSTIAHGLLVLSLLPRFSYEVGLLPPDAARALNYGFDKVRFIAPVPSGARLRDEVSLTAVQRKAPGQALVEARHCVHVEGSDKPVLVAQALSLLIGPADRPHAGAPR